MWLKLSGPRRWRQWPWASLRSPHLRRIINHEPSYLRAQLTASGCRIVFATLCFSYLASLWILCSCDFVHLRQFLTWAFHPVFEIATFSFSVHCNLCLSVLSATEPALASVSEFCDFDFFPLLERFCFLILCTPNKGRILSYRSVCFVSACGS